MADGFVIAYHAQPGRAHVAAYLASLGERGLVLRNPMTGRVTELDETGCQVERSPSDLIDAIWQQGVHDVITFQLWVRRDVDVVCAHVPLSGSVGAYRFSLDGLGSSTQGVVEAIACELATPASRIIGLVIDRDGQSDDHHWDEAIRRAASGVSLGGVSAFVRYGESA